MLRRPFVRAAAFLSLAVVGGCSDLTSPDGVAGRYDLVAIDGSPLPYVVSSFDVRTEYSSGSLDLRNDRSFTLRLRASVLDRRTGAVYTDDAIDVGTYRVSGSEIRFTVTDGDIAEPGDVEYGTVSGATVEVEGFTFRR